MLLLSDCDMAIQSLLNSNKPELYCQYFRYDRVSEIFIHILLQFLNQVRNCNASAGQCVTKGLVVRHPWVKKILGLNNLF